MSKLLTVRSAEVTARVLLGLQAIEVMGFFFAFLLSPVLAWSQMYAYAPANFAGSNARPSYLAPVYPAPTTAGPAYLPYNAQPAYPVYNNANYQYINSVYKAPRYVTPRYIYAQPRYNYPVPAWGQPQPSPSFNFGGLLSMIGSLFSGGAGAQGPTPAAGFGVSVGAPERVPYCARCSLHAAPIEPLPEVTEAPVTRPVYHRHETEAGLPARYVPHASGGDRVAAPDEDEAPRPRRVHPVAAPAESVHRAREKHPEFKLVPPPKRAPVHRVRERFTPRQRQQVRALDRDERRAQHAPIWASFSENFAACAPGCEPVGYASYGDRGNLSCHPTGRALDLHGMSCGGQTIRAIGDSPAWNSMLACMRTRMHVLYQNKPWNGGANITAGHYDHAHFSDGCVVRGHHVW